MEWQAIRWFGPNDHQKKPAALASIKSRCGWFAADDGGKVDHDLLTALNFVGSFDGQDNQGRPVFYANIGRVDLSALDDEARHGKIAYGVKRHMAITLLEMRDLARQQKQKPQCTAVCDLEGFGWQHLGFNSLQLVGELLEMYETWFQDAAACVLLVNPPWMMPVFWELLRPLVPYHLAQRIHIVSGTYSFETRADLLKEWLF